MQRFILAVLIALPIVIMQSCAAPLLLATAAPAGAAVARAGTAAYSNRQLRVARYASLEETWDATHSALERLQLTVHTERISERQRYIMAKDDNRYPEMIVRLDRRSPVMTKISIRVGILGDPAVSNHLLRHIDEFLVMQRSNTVTQ